MAAHDTTEDNYGLSKTTIGIMITCIAGIIGLLVVARRYCWLSGLNFGRMIRSILDSRITAPGNIAILVTVLALLCWMLNIISTEFLKTLGVTITVLIGVLTYLYGGDGVLNRNGSNSAIHIPGPSMASSSTALMESDHADDAAVSQEQHDRLFRVVSKEKLLKFIDEKGGYQHRETIVGRRSSLKAALKECFGLEENSFILRILSTRLKEGYVTDGELDEIAEKFPVTEYETFCHKLGFEDNIPGNILASHSKTYRSALRQILGDWKNKDGGPRMVLEAALITSKAGKLAEILYR